MGPGASSLIYASPLQHTHKVSCLTHEGEAGRFVHVGQGNPDPEPDPELEPNPDSKPQVVAVFVVAADRMPEVRAFQQSMDALNAFMHAEHLPHEMRRRLREYFHHTKHLRATERHQKLLEMMSGTLQAEVAWAVNRKWLQNIFFLRRAPQAFMVQLALHLQPLVFAPSEVCPPGLLYIVHRGLALFDGRLMTKGKVWGEDIILLSLHLRSKHCARALTFLDVLTIDREELDEIGIGFPKTAARIRRQAIRLATRRAFILEASFRKQIDSGRTASFKSGRSASSKSPMFDRMLMQMTRFGPSSIEEEPPTAEGEAAPAEESMESASSAVAASKVVLDKRRDGRKIPVSLKIRMAASIPANGSLDDDHDEEEAEVGGESEKTDDGVDGRQEGRGDKGGGREGGIGGEEGGIDSGKGGVGGKTDSPTHRCSPAPRLPLGAASVASAASSLASATATSVASAASTSVAAASAVLQRTSSIGSVSGGGGGGDGRGGGEAELRELKDTMRQMGIQSQAHTAALARLIEEVSAMREDLRAPGTRSQDTERSSAVHAAFLSSKSKSFSSTRSEGSASGRIRRCTTGMREAPAGSAQSESVEGSEQLGAEHSGDKAATRGRSISRVAFHAASLSSKSKSSSSTHSEGSASGRIRRCTTGMREAPAGSAQSESVEGSEQLRAVELPASVSPSAGGASGQLVRDPPPPSVSG